MNYVIINYYLCVYFVLDSSEMSLILFVSLCMQFWRRTYLGESVNSEDGLPGARFSNFFEIDNLKFRKNMKKNLGCR
jgi:hypothetical protein